MGFVLSAAEARELLARGSDLGPRYADVIRPFLTGEDLVDAVDQSPTRYVIDFGERGLELASRYVAAIQRVRDLVKPDRERNRDRYRREHWWLFGRPYTAVRTEMSSRNRYAAMNQVGKRPLFAWYESRVCPNSKINVFAFDDDFSMGVLISRAHGAWAWSQGSTLKGDLSYTPTSVFNTFPWPDPVSGVQRDRVADACRRLLERRTHICQQEQVGLTTLYNAVDEGAWTDLKALHRELDEAVAQCYGWPRAVAQDDAELVRRLTELNREIAEGGRPYDPYAHLDEQDQGEG